MQAVFEVDWAHTPEAKTQASATAKDPADKEKDKATSDV
jgi:hypothetical protein